MRLRFTIVIDKDVGLECYPGATTPEEALKMEQSYIEDGSISVEDIIDVDEISVKVALIDAS